MGISDASSTPTIRKRATNTAHPLVVESSSAGSSSSKSQKDANMEPCIPTSPLASSSSSSSGGSKNGSKAAAAAAMADQQRMAGIEKAHNNDVLCGRGVTTNRHPGNMSFRGLVNCNKELYVTSTKKQKMTISRSIVDAVRARNPPGRFLEKDTATGLWFDIGDKKALEKTSQALRDGAAGLRKQLSEDLSDPDFLKAVFDDSGIATGDKGGGGKAVVAPMKHAAAAAAASSRNRLKGPGHRRTVSDITSSSAPTAAAAAAAFRSKPSSAPKRQTSMEIDHPTPETATTTATPAGLPRGPSHSPSPSVTPSSSSFASSSEQRKASRHNRAQSVGAMPYKVASLDLPSFDSHDFDWGAPADTARRTSTNHPGMGLAEVREHLQQFEFQKLSHSIPPRPHENSTNNHRRSPSLPHAPYGGADYQQHHPHHPQHNHHHHHHHHPPPSHHHHHHSANRSSWSNGGARSSSPSYGGRPPPPPGALSPGRAGAAAAASRPPAFPVQTANNNNNSTNNSGEGERPGSGGSSGGGGGGSRRHTSSYHHRHLTPPTANLGMRGAPAVSRDETASPSGDKTIGPAPVRVHTSPNHFESGKSFQFIGGKLKAVDSSPSSSNGMPTPLDLTDSPVVRTFSNNNNNVEDFDDEDIKNESVDALERLDSFDLTPLPFEAESLELTDPLLDFHQQILSLPLTAQSPTSMEENNGNNNEGTAGASSTHPMSEVVPVGDGE